MRIELTEEPTTALTEYARIPIAFMVDRVFDVSAPTDGRSGFTLSERRIDVPYLKDYDARGVEGPRQWSRQFDLSNWVLIAARIAGKRVGGAAVVINSPDVEMLEGRGDLAVLWDIRVAPAARGMGIGSALFEKAEAWARRRGYCQIKVESQNINVPACRFYARQGCELRGVNRLAYRDLPEEIQLLWYKDLDPAPPRSDE